METSTFESNAIATRAEHLVNTLCDTYGRTHTYLRISVTDRCNLRCRYCMPAGGIELRPKTELLSFDEIEYLARVFVGLGIKKIRLTGGEPLVRHGIESLCKSLAQIANLDTLAFSTNGVLLAEKARQLRDAGVQQLNISLDTLRPERFQRITLRAGFYDVFGGLDAALSAGFQSVKVNTVVIRGFNDDEILDFVEFAKDRSLNLRFIEYMPFLGNAWTEGTFLPYHQMRQIIQSRHALVPLDSDEINQSTAKQFLLAGSEAVIGFITTMSESFCGTCSRLRLTAEGTLRNCLFAREEFNLRSLLRSGATEEMIEETIRAAVLAKWEEHPESTELVWNSGRAMVAVGG